MVEVNEYQLNVEYTKKLYQLGCDACSNKIDENAKRYIYQNHVNGLRAIDLNPQIGDIPVLTFNHILGNRGEVVVRFKMLDRETCHKVVDILDIPNLEYNIRIFEYGDNNKCRLELVCKETPDTKGDDV